jgi:hypothetical protein
MSFSAPEVVRSTIERATSGFSPVPADATNLVVPVAQQPLGGYGTYLADLDEDRLWLQMLRPGSSGLGLFVACYNPHVCCYGQGAQASVDDVDGVPLLFPALVHWTSVTDPATGQVALDVLQDWKEDLSFPPVGITSDWWLDDGDLMPWVNLIHSEEAEWQETATYVGDLNQVLTGLAAPWQLVPLTEEAAKTLADFLAERRDVLDSHILGRTSHELQEGDGDEESWYAENHDWNLEDGEPSRCSYTLGARECACGAQPTAIQLFTALVEPLMDRVHTTDDLFVPPELHLAWRLALHHFAVGWLAVAARVKEGDAWSTYCWQRLSPFSGSHSLATLLQRLSVPSTSSGTLPAFSTASSPQLTLFDSSPTGSPTAAEQAAVR